MLKRISLPEQKHLKAQELMVAGKFSEADIATKGLVEQSINNCTITNFGDTTNHGFSIVVVSYQTTPKFLNGIQALAEASRDLSDAEFIFISNAHDGLEDILTENFSNFTLIEVGFNFGCCGARNVGAKIARGDIIVFIDDDGITSASSIRALVTVLGDPRVVAVRGRAEPFPGQDTPPHYRPGERPIPRFIDLEGMSAWRRKEFNDAGGFNVLLVGHEGIDLTARIVKTHGYDAFRYEPTAVLQHDYAPNPVGLEAKREKQQRGARYLLSRGVSISALTSVFYQIQGDPFQNSVFQNTINRPRTMVPANNLRASFLTTAKNGIEFVGRHRQSLLSQTDENFEVIVVDDHSNDGTSEAIKQAWKGDSRLKIVKNIGAGRADALNQGMFSSDADVFLIADIDDYSYPDRLAETKRAFLENPSAMLVGFLISDDKHYVRLGRPSNSGVSCLKVRQLFGMPAPFPGLAFKRMLGMREQFNTELVAAIDYDWVARVLRYPWVHGSLIPRPMSYYHTHEGQITHRHGDKQRATGKAIISQVWKELLQEDLSNSAADAALRLAGWLHCQSETHVKEMKDLATRALSANASFKACHQGQLETALTLNASIAIEHYLRNEAKRAKASQ